MGRLGVVVQAARPPDELEAGRDVAPLVGAAHLELDAHRPVQVGEVVRLEQHVAELRERQPALQAHLDRVLGQHVRDREVLARVAQELDQRQLAQPVEVVDHDRAVAAGREVEEPLELAADPGDVDRRASRGRAGSAPTIAPTGRRSSRSRRRRPRPAGRRSAAAGAGRRSARGGRRGARRRTDRTRCSRRSTDRARGGRPGRASWRAGCRASRARRAARPDRPPTRPSQV